MSMSQLSTAIFNFLLLLPTVAHAQIIPFANWNAAGGNSCSNPGPVGMTVLGDSNVTISSPISVNAPHAIGVLIQGNLTGTVTVNTNISVSGAGSIGVLICGSLAGSFTLNTGGSIVVSGDIKSYGIAGCPSSGSVTINNGASITSSGTGIFCCGLPAPVCK